MILSDKHLIEFIKSEKIIFQPPVDPKQIRSNHIDLHLSSKLLKYKSKKIDLKDTSGIKVKEIMIDGNKGYILKPGEFILGSTLEEVTIPNGYFGFIETKGNIARAGIQTHNTDGHVDPGFKGTITLEIKNNANHSIKIYPHMLFIQIYFFENSSLSINPYQGKYQNQKGATIYQED